MVEKIIERILGSKLREEISANPLVSYEILDLQALKKAAKTIFNITVI